METKPFRPEPDEANLQERPIDIPADESLTALQVLHEHLGDMENANTPGSSPNDQIHRSSRRFPPMRTA